MKKSANKILLILTLGLLIIADSVGKSTAFVDSEETSELIDGVSAANWTIFSPSLAEDMESVDFKSVRKFSEEYGTDERLILALMKQESQFDENAVSYRGARGLMQIMPVTNLELVEELDLPKSSLPRENIQAGIYYFSKLYRLFKTGTKGDRIRLALAAYNAGPSRIYDAQDLAAYLGENPNEWRSIRNVLPLLSKRYYSLHGAVWSASRPPAGYFGSWRETSSYVDAVMKTYKGYRSGK